MGREGSRSENEKENDTPNVVGVGKYLSKISWSLGESTESLFRSTVRLYLLGNVFVLGYFCDVEREMKHRLSMNHASYHRV